MTTTETTPQKKNGSGHRYQKGHPHHPRWRAGAQTQAPVFKRRSMKILRALVAERGGELSDTQLIHAENAADLGAAILELRDRRKVGKPVDPIQISNLINAQRRALAALDE